MLQTVTPIAILLISSWALMWYVAMQMRAEARRAVCPCCDERLDCVADAKRFYHIDYVLWECSGCSRLYVRCSGLIPWKNWLPWEKWKGDLQAQRPEHAAGLRHLKYPWGCCDGETKARVAKWYGIPEATIQQRHRLWYFGPYD